MLIDIGIFKTWEFAKYLIMVSALYGVIQLVKMLFFGWFK